MDHVEEAKRLLNIGWMTKEGRQITDYHPEALAAQTAAQTHALLALVEQQKRIADMLEEMTITFRQGDRHLQITIRNRDRE